MKLKKAKKQFFSALLICLLIIGLFPVQTLAATGDSCTVRVNVGTNACTFKVPFGSSLDITWEFTEENGKLGYLMLVNGKKPVKSGYGGYTYNDISPIEATSLASMAVMTTTGKPDNISITPDENQCLSGKTINLSTNPVPLTPDQCEFEVLYVNRENNQTIGTYKGSDGKGYHASTIYGTFNINAGTTLLKNYVTQNLKGYRLCEGKPGAPDKQNISLQVGENGVSPKSVTMYVEVNHNAISELHTQKVYFSYNGASVLEATVPMKGNHNYGDEKIALDLSGMNDKLKVLGYTYDESKAYTTTCDGYTHSPEITTIEVTEWFPYEYTISDNSAFITKYLGFDTDVHVPAEIEGKPVTRLEAGAFAGNSSLNSVILPSSLTSVGDNAFANCTSLTKADIGKNVTFIADSAFTGSSNAVIYGYPDSRALTFAKENQITFVCKEHKFGDWKVSKKPACTEKGEETRSCSCGETESRSLDAVGHSFGDWKVSKDPTTKETGIKERICSICNMKETESIPVLSDSPSDPADKNEPDKNQPDKSEPGKNQPDKNQPGKTIVKTGDETGIFTWVTVLLISGIGFAILCKKKQHN